MFADRWVLHDLTAWSLMRDRAQVGAALLADADMRGEANRTEKQQARGRCVVLLLRLALPFLDSARAMCARVGMPVLCRLRPP